MSKIINTKDYWKNILLSELELERISITNYYKLPRSVSQHGLLVENIDKSEAIVKSYTKVATPTIYKKVINSNKTKNYINRYITENPSQKIRVYKLIKPYTLNEKHSFEKIDPNLYDDLLKKISVDFSVYLSKFDNTYSLTDEIPAEKVANIFKIIINQLIKDSNLNYENKWVIKIKNIKNFNINTKKQILIIPSATTKYKIIRGFIAHEIFVHFLRHLNSTKYQLIERLPGYRNFEEGLAQTLQQIFAKRSFISIHNSNSAMILVLFNIGFTVYEIEQILKTNHNLSKESIDRYIKKLQLNIIKITQKNKPTITLTKTKTFNYLTGTIGLYILIKEYKTTNNIVLKGVIEKIFKIILITKFDPFKLSHINYLIEAKILTLNSNEIVLYEKFLLSKCCQLYYDLIPN